MEASSWHLRVPLLLDRGPTTYGYKVPVLALEWPGVSGVSVGGVPRTGHASSDLASLTKETGGDPRTDHASSVGASSVTVTGGDPKTVHASFCARMADEMAATCSHHRAVGPATQTAHNPVSPGLDPVLAVSSAHTLASELRDEFPSRHENPEFRDGLPSTQQRPGCRDGFPSSGDIEGLRALGSKIYELFI